MYKLLIADDEQITRKAIKMLLTKYVPEITEIFETGSGRGAIELSANVHPDIICMDIKMPGIDGMEAIRVIKERSPATEIIIISAYDEFDVAKDAMQLGISHYILKPISREEFIPAIENVIRKKKQQKKKRESEFNLQEQISKVRNELSRQVVYALMMGDVEKLEDYHYLQTIGGDMGGMAVIVDFRSGQRSEENVKAYCNRAYQHISNYLDQPSKGVISHSLGNKVTVFLYNYGAEKNVEAWMQREIQHIADIVGEKTSISCAIGYGPYVYSLKSMYTSYSAATRAVMSGNTGEGITICPPTERNEDYRYPMKLENEIFKAISMEDSAAALDAFSEFFDYVVAYSDDNREFIYKQMFVFSVGLARLCVEKGIEDVNNLGLEYMYDTVAIRSWCEMKIERCIRNLKNIKEDYSDDLIGDAIAFIEKNYAQVISLSDISGKVNLSSFYFTKLFKAKTGMTFVEYLTDYRMKVAKKLLEENMELKVQDVGERVGYMDYKYFCKCFRKNTGVTPASYRSQLSPGKSRELKLEDSSDVLKMKKERVEQ